MKSCSSRDVKSEARRNEEKIPEQRAERGEKERRPAAQARGGEDHREQIEERDRPVAGVIEDGQTRTRSRPRRCPGRIPNSRQGARRQTFLQTFRAAAAPLHPIGIMWMSMLPLWRISQRERIAFPKAQPARPQRFADDDLGDVVLRARCGAAFRRHRARASKPLPRRAGARARGNASVAPVPPAKAGRGPSMFATIQDASIEAASRRV